MIIDHLWNLEIRLMSLLMVLLVIATLVISLALGMINHQYSNIILFDLDAYIWIGQRWWSWWRPDVVVLMTTDHGFLRTFYIFIQILETSFHLDAVWKMFASLWNQFQSISEARQVLETQHSGLLITQQMSTYGMAWLITKTLTSYALIFSSYCAIDDQVMIQVTLTDSKWVQLHRGNPIFTVYPIWIAFSTSDELAVAAAIDFPDEIDSNDVIILHHPYMMTNLYSLHNHCQHPFYPSPDPLCWPDLRE